VDCAPARATTPRGQIEAAQALAIRPRLIIIPEAARYALCSFGNDVILVLKGSAVAGVVTLFDLLGATRFAFQRTYDFQVYLAAAVVYIVIVEIIRRLLQGVEKRLSLHVQKFT
jgi:polar amino acid transport system permease protein